MAQEDATVKIIYENSGEELTIPLSELVTVVTGFLDRLGVASLVGERFAEIIGAGDGHDKLHRLLTACGHTSTSTFFSEVLNQLGKADSGQDIVINSISMPHLLLMAILEVVLPGDQVISITSTRQLEEITNTRIPLSDRQAMQQVIDTYPVRLSMHTIRQMRVSRDVAYQYLPFVEELDDVGHTNTWIGQFHQGLLEQMYQNRVIFLLNMSCPVYCRFCFRKHKESRNQANPTISEVRQAVEHVKNSPHIKEVVVTGGDPFLNRANMAGTIDELMEVEQVRTLRLATRSVAYYPHMFLGEEGRLLSYLKRKNLELQEHGKRLELATHFIHYDEISPQSLQIITELVNNGIAVYIQTPFLHGCNDQGPELVRLFNLLRGAGAELHYIYIPCSPIHGNRVYWAPLSNGVTMGKYLRAHLSDRAIPRICTATPIGKMDWNSSGWAVEPVAGNDDFIWIRSPYTPDYFKSFAPLANELKNIRVNEEGTIDIQYMAKIGDEKLFLGPRPKREDKSFIAKLLPISELPPAVVAGGEISPSIVTTGSPLVSRVHATRVELSAACSEKELAYVRQDNRITDVVIVSGQEASRSLTVIGAIISALKQMVHVNSVRLRCPDFTTNPEYYTTEVIDTLASWNKLTIAEPLRLEIECRFLTAEQVLPEHARLVRRLNNRGITVYCNTPLLGRINDTADAIHDLAYRLRNAGIEFHHLYLAGLPVQNRWNTENPVALYDVVDIATRVRRDGSGREIPRYIIRTVLGEVDFGLSSLITGTGKEVSVQLLPYDLAYFKALSGDFSWPEGVETTDDQHPVVAVTGLFKTTAFALS